MAISAILAVNLIVATASSVSTGFAPGCSPMQETRLTAARDERQGNPLDSS